VGYSTKNPFSPGSSSARVLLLLFCAKDFLLWLSTNLQRVQCRHQRLHFGVWLEERLGVRRDPKGTTGSASRAEGPRREQQAAHPVLRDPEGNNRQRIPWANGETAKEIRTFFLSRNKVLLGGWIESLSRRPLHQQFSWVDLEHSKAERRKEGKVF
jgi:hypothetical protein